jgi:uncharacterized membrane protein
MMLLSGVLWVLLIVAIVLLAVWVVRMARHGHDDATHGMAQGAVRGDQTASVAHDEAVAIARKRFAAGEITKEQFDELMQTLG